MRINRISAILWSGTLALAAGDPRAAACRDKIDQIETGRGVKAGAVYQFSSAEINAYAREELPKVIPQGLRNPSLELGTNSAVGYALMDFLKMQQAKGVQVSWLMQTLLDGERPVRVAIDARTANGRAIIYLRRVEISDVAASGTVLDFLIRNFFRPLYPEAHINEWFEMGHNVDRIDVQPTSVRVYIKSKLSPLPAAPKLR